MQLLPLPDGVPPAVEGGGFAYLWENQRKWVGKGWRPAATSTRGDPPPYVAQRSGAAAASPAGLRYEPHRDGTNDEEGWWYAASFASFEGRSRWLGKAQSIDRSGGRASERGGDWVRRRLLRVYAPPAAPGAGAVRGERRAAPPNAARAGGREASAGDAARAGLTPGVRVRHIQRGHGVVKQVDSEGRVLIRFASGEYHRYEAHSWPKLAVLAGAAADDDADLLPWRCGRCTYDNPASVLCCEMCGGVKPCGVVPPPAAPAPPSQRGSVTAWEREAGCDCVVCMDGAQEVVCDPCGHMSMCRACAAQVRQCPICRRRIARLISVFRA